MWLPAFFLLASFALASCTSMVTSSLTAGPSGQEAPGMVLIPWAVPHGKGCRAGVVAAGHTVYLDPYLIHRTEVTIADLEDYAAATHAVVAASDVLSAQIDKSFPAFGIIWSEADA